MCLDPVTMALMAAGTAMTAGGGMISSNEAQDNANGIAAARNSVLMDTIRRQNGFMKQSGEILDNRMQDFTKPAQKEALNTAQTERGTANANNITASPAPATGIPGISGSAPTIVKGEIAKRMLDSFKGATDNAKRLGKLGGYGDTWGGNTIGVADAGRRIGTFNNFSQGENAILPSMQDYAQIQATQKPSIWGPLLTAGGQMLAGVAGRAGSNLFAPTPPVATPTAATPTGMNPWGTDPRPYG